MNPTTFLPVLVSKSTKIASRIELVVVPLTIQEAIPPLPPNIPNDDPRSPPFASKKKNWVHNYDEDIIPIIIVQTWKTLTTPTSPLSLSLMRMQRSMKRMLLFLLLMMLSMKQNKSLLQS